jgi:hypothetical protein
MRTTFLATPPVNFDEGCVGLCRVACVFHVSQTSRMQTTLDAGSQIQISITLPRTCSPPAGSLSGLGRAKTQGRRHCLREMRLLQRWLSGRGISGDVHAVVDWGELLVVVVVGGGGCGWKYYRQTHPGMFVCT